MNRLTSSIRTRVPSDRAINKFRLCLRSYRPNDERAPVKPLSGIVLLKESRATLLLVLCTTVVHYSKLVRYIAKCLQSKLTRRNWQRRYALKKLVSSLTQTKILIELETVFYNSPQTYINKLACVYIFFLWCLLMYAIADNVLFRD